MCSDCDPSWITSLAALAGVGAFLTAAAIPLTAFFRRPSLTMHEDHEGIHSQVEGNGVPYVRLLVRNKKLRRTAHNAQVFVARYEQNGKPGSTRTMGSPELGWTSLFESNGVVFAGGERPFDFGNLQAFYSDNYGRALAPHPQEEPATTIHKTGQWWFRFALAHNLFIVDQREYLPPRTNGYVVRLDLGAEEGPARSYLIHLNWEGSAKDAQAALDSVQIELTR